eukprot:scaffold78520_cov38-Tisochrysis_lutea.AAC.1
MIAIRGTKNSVRNRPHVLKPSSLANPIPLTLVRRVSMLWQQSTPFSPTAVGRRLQKSGWVSQSKRMVHDEPITHTALPVDGGARYGGNTRLFAPAGTGATRARNA